MCAFFVALTPSPSPTLWARGVGAHGGAPCVPPSPACGRGGQRGLKGVGFLRACLLAALPSRAFLPSCERDARVPSTRDAGNAGVPPAMPTAREKTYPFELGGRGIGGEGKKACAPRARRTYAMYSYQGWKHTLVGANGKRQQQRRYPATHPCPKPTRVGEPSSSPRNAICTTCHTPLP